MLADKTKLVLLLNHLCLDLLDIPRRHFVQINKITLDSRQADSNTLFLAIFGSQTSGHQYIDKAATNGCEFALLDTIESSKHGNVERRNTITAIFVHDLHAKLADIAACFYLGKKMQEISCEDLPVLTAVTGTNGKTSVAALMAQLSDLCHRPCASIGTLGVNLFNNGKQHKLNDTLNTTPDIVTLIGTLASLKSQGCLSAVLEASSHGLAQNRLNKLTVGCAVFTNLSQDHLDYHATMDTYSHAKRQLLLAQGLNTVVLNADDKESLHWQSDAHGEQKIYWYSLNKLPTEKQGCWASDISYSNGGISFTLHAQFTAVKADKHVSAPLIGAFNVANLLAALTALLAQGLSFSALVKASQKISGVCGRMELFTSAKASLLVDYAHTPDALKQALLAARVHTQGQLTCIFGCGGNRDTSKRALMGNIATQYADSIVLTQDNSRNEEPADIIADIRSGMNTLKSGQTLDIELNRELAIAKTWQASNVKDLILVAGKGHEDYMEIKGKYIAYDEREVVRMLTATNMAPKSSTRRDPTQTNIRRVDQQSAKARSKSLEKKNHAGDQK
jgi:UDP-N-acetylmuramoyl-L-alanyl-D-glutamate--2,6-diaminopimelate ligase